MRKAASDRLISVTARLRAMDVAELKRRARERAIGWQTLLRVMVADALKRKTEIE